MFSVIVEMIVTATTDMIWTPPPTISSRIIMCLSLKNVSITCNFNQKQHVVHVNKLHVI
jgi:hypothetical protein